MDRNALDTHTSDRSHGHGYPQTKIDLNIKPRYNFFARCASAARPCPNQMTKGFYLQCHLPLSRTCSDLFVSQMSDCWIVTYLNTFFVHL